MPVRPQPVVEEALIDFLYEESRPVPVKEVYQPLADRLGLTDEERTRSLASQPENAWENLVRFARRRLVDRKQISKELKGFWSLTETGRRLGSKRRAERASFDSADFMQDGTEAFIEAVEGRESLRIHLIRERSQTLVDAFKDSLTSPSCRACGFDFEVFYGELGRGYIEAHHSIPVADLVSGVPTKLSDLVPLCANCHRMVHRSGLLPVDDLKRVIQKERG